MPTVMDDSRRQECLQTDVTTWEIGPYHGALPGPMRVRFQLDGEVIIAAKVETGFLHRGLEKAMELHPWEAATVYADHLDSEGAFFGELALCLAVEEIAGIEVPSRAQAIRVVISEIARISSHLVYAARLARSVGAETLVHYVLRDREKLLDLFELLTGARFSLNFSRYGGVAGDVTDGFIERVLEVTDLLRIRQKEYNDLFTFNQTFLKRTRGVGVLTSDDIRNFGVTGPNARASGVAIDIRKAHPYCGFDKIDFDALVIRGDGIDEVRGDTHDRFLLRLREISQSLGILRDTVDGIPSGPFCATKPATKPEGPIMIPAGEAYARVESARGLLGCHVISDGKRMPTRVQFRTPTSSHILLVPKLVQGIRIEDFPVFLASLDLSIAEADR